MNGAPLGLPVIGHALSFVRDKPGFLQACRQQYGDCVRLHIGAPTWLLNNPADIKHVLVDAAAKYEKTPKLTSPRGRVLSGSGLHTATGLDHVFLRRMVQPLFHRRVVDGHAQMVRRVTENAMADWRDGHVIDLLDAMLKLTQQVMLAALFGESFVDDRGQFADAVTVRRSYIEYFFTSNLPWPEHWPLPLVHRYRTARRYLGEIIDREIDRRRTGVPVGDDWLSMLVSSTGRNGTALNKAQIRDEAITLTSTGYETVAAALTWSGHLLSIHPDVQRDVQLELAVDETPDAPLTTRVLNEAMRLFPPTWLFVRVATTDDVLPGGATIRADDHIYLCPFTMHRHPAWYARPDHFDPSHFSDEAMRARPRFAFYPFGGGARQCIGEPFARLEAAVVLSTLLRRFQLEPINTDPVRLRPSIVLEPRGGLRVRLRGAR